MGRKAGIENKERERKLMGKKPGVENNERGKRNPCGEKRKQYKTHEEETSWEEKRWELSQELGLQHKVPIVVTRSDPPRDPSPHGTLFPAILTPDCAIRRYPGVLCVGPGTRGGVVGDRCVIYTPDTLSSSMLLDLGDRCRV